MRARFLLSATAAAITLAMLTGCTGATAGSAAQSVTPVSTAPLAELDTLEDPRSYQGGSTAVLQQSDITPVLEAPEQALPVTVTSHDLGGDIEITVTSAERVIGLDIAGSIGATIAGLGFADRLVGRDISTAFPAVADVPVVTSSAHTINAEAVLKLRPDLVITDGSIGPIDVVLQLRDAGVTVVFVDREASIDGVAVLARQVAAALGATEAGELLAERVRQQIDQKVAEIAAIAPRDPEQQLRVLFLYLRGTAGVYYLFGEESGADVLIEALGARDVAGEIGWDGMKPMTDEALVAANPDLILVMSSGLESVGGIDSLVAEMPAIELTTAGQNRRFVDMADSDILGFGPRLPDVLDALARAIYAPGQ
ncbi:ABC transporter substrate-binding protein [Salinibacterium sp. ZJ454]|uniref:heme/hemin ABC transporter substrate-binding protein n=1 Tax=Salinibacterium sp. ZJ454 TaxID=2708339 RepID=UPI001423C6C7|nr:ABC transporter substrate-binding protein [Salinibacterium sp. ZJ454]